MIGVQMGDEEVRHFKINLKMLQSGLHRIKAFLSIEPGIDDE